MSQAQRSFSSTFNKGFINSVEKSENLIYSPLSIFLAIAMVLCGSREDTLSETISALGFNQIAAIQSESNPLKKLDMINDEMKVMMNIFKEAEKEKIVRVVNKLYVDHGFKVEDVYAQVLKEKYDTQLEKCDFLKNSNEERKMINTFVEKFTNNRITNLLPNGMVNSQTKSIIVNAIYFKGAWESKFDEKQTQKNKEFYVFNANNKVNVDLMSKSNCKTYYGEYKNQFKFVKLPYKGKNYSMFVMLPVFEGEQAFQDMEKTVNEKVIPNYHEELTYREQELSQLKIPKFKTEVSKEVIPILKSIGMNKLFNGADLSGMNKNNEVEISNIIHKAFIEVNEEGTEAAAATAIVFRLTSVSFEPKIKFSFVADRPFMYMIVHEQSNTVLFSGRMIKPST